MISVTSSGLASGWSSFTTSGFESISAQISWRCLVRALITTTGWFGSKARAMSVIGTAPVCSNACWLSRPGTLVTIRLPGLKPSARFWSVVPTRVVVLVLVGVDWLEMFSRRFVGVDASATVKWSFGNG